MAQKKNRFQTAYSRIRNPKDRIKIIGPSLTRPQESMTLKEIFKRHIAGTLPMPTVNDVFVDDVDFDSPDYEKFQNLDMAEKELLVIEKSSIVNEVKEKLNQKEKEKLAAQNRAAFEKSVLEEVEKRRKESEKSKEE